MNVEPQPQFVSIWVYSVQPAHLREFQRIYGPGGDWVQLFSRAQGFIKTELRRDYQDPHRFVTVDYWQSESCRDQFKSQFASEYATLDAMCDKLTREEHFVGDFV